MSRFLPKAFDGFTILQLSDLHVEMSEAAMMRLAAMLPDIDYDICVLTGVTTERKRSAPTSPHLRE
jgi:uncharacterized protein